MLFPELEETPPNRRMSRFLELSFEYRDSIPAELAEKLGYSRDTTVLQWMRGSAKVPLRHLSTDRIRCRPGHYHLGVADRLCRKRRSQLLQRIGSESSQRVTRARLINSRHH